MVKQPQTNLKGDAHLFEAWGKLLFHVIYLLFIDIPRSHPSPQHATKAVTSRDNPLTHDEVVTLLQSADGTSFAFRFHLSHHPLPHRQVRVCSWYRQQLGGDVRRMGTHARFLGAEFCGGLSSRSALETFR